MSTITDEIKERIDLVELVGRAVQLRRSGSSSFKGLCPFHQEKTPSFYVFPQSHTFVCFGCGKKGTAFDWLMEREHVEFGEALRTLAQVAGVELPSRPEPREEQATARLYEVLARAQAFYRGLLLGTAGESARAYLASRGVTEETGGVFGLGYASSGNALLRYLKEAEFTDEEVVQAGVISIADDGRLYDFFRDRVLFPIRNAKGRVIAFGGRTLGDHTPKYINTRDTLVFHKQETLFAIDLARASIIQERRAIIVEGYLDAVMAHQHGYRNVVATLGTAVTERHLSQLRRMTDEIVLALDSDAAGQAATWRALQLAEQSLRSGVTPVVGPNRRSRQYVAHSSVHLKVLSIPSAKDPDELIRSEPATWRTLVQGSLPITEFAIGQLGRRHDLATAEGKAAAADEIADLLAGIANPIEQTHYIQQAAGVLKVDEAAVRRILQQKQRFVRPGSIVAPHEATAAATPRVTYAGSALDEYALALLLAGAEADPHQEMPFAESDFALPETRAMFRLLSGVLRGVPASEVPQRVPQELQPAFQQVGRRAREVDLLAGPEVIAREARLAHLRMRYRDLEDRRRQVRQLIFEATEDTDRQRWAAELSSVAQELNRIGESLVMHERLVGAAKSP